MHQSVAVVLTNFKGLHKIEYVILDFLRPLGLRKSSLRKVDDCLVSNSRKDQNTVLSIQSEYGRKQESHFRFQFSKFGADNTNREYAVSRTDGISGPICDCGHGERVSDPEQVTNCASS